MSYYYSKTVKAQFEPTVEKLRSLLAPEGFGVVTEMDVQHKLKEKLNVDFKPYLILGTCNPKLAYQALQKEDKLGTILPCNFMIQKIDDQTTEVAAINPEEAMQAINNPGLTEFANEVGKILRRILDKL